MANERILRNIRLADGSIVKFEHRKSLTSTAALAKSYANAGYPNKYVVFTEKQYSNSITKSKLTAGAPDKGMFLSCILRPSFFPAQAGLLGPLATVALLSGLEKHTDKRLNIGWVSDIYCEGIRIGGASVEGKLNNTASYEYLIVTFAIHIDQKLFPPKLNDMIRKVFEDENESVEMIMAKTVLNKFFAVYSSMKNPEKYMDLYQRKFILRDKKIKQVVDGKKRALKVVDVDPKTCALTVEKRRGETEKITSPFGIIVPNKIKLDKS